MGWVFRKWKRGYYEKWGWDEIVREVMHMNGGGYGDVGVVTSVMEFEGWNGW